MQVHSIGSSCRMPMTHFPSWGLLGRLACAGLMGFASIGCQLDEEGASQVSGRVSYHGEPIRGGSVFLMPPSGFAGSWGAGIIGKDGAFIVKTTREGLPLEPGPYGVSFTLPTPHHGQASNPAAFSSIKIPDKYLHIEKPVFKIEIGGEEPVQVDITLRD